MATYSLHPEPPAPIHHLKKVVVCFTPKPVESGNLKVAPKMTHVIDLPFHGLRINIRQCALPSFSAEDFFGERRLILGIVGDQRLGFFGWLAKHLPQTLGGEIIDSFISRCVPKYIGDGFFQLLDSNGKPICFIMQLHMNKWITVESQQLIEIT